MWGGHFPPTNWNSDRIEPEFPEIGEVMEKVTCSSCGAVMQSGLTVYSSGVLPYGANATLQVRLFNESGKAKNIYARACPHCGKVEFYVKVRS